jgi:beta-galactosidase
VPVDVVFSDSDLSGYDMLIAPLLHMVKPGLPEQIEALVARGGTFVTTYFSGVVDETDLAFEGYPGPLSKLLGIRVEEIDALYEGQTNRIVLADGSGSYTCARLCDIIHSEGAHVYATYGDDFYAGTPAVTEHRFGDGWAYYLASDPEDRFLDAFYGRLLKAYATTPPISTPDGVEVALRQTERHDLLFILNHSASGATVALPPGARYADLLHDQEVAGSLALAGYDARILATERRS